MTRKIERTEVQRNAKLEAVVTERVSLADQLVAAEQALAQVARERAQVFQMLDAVLAKYGNAIELPVSVLQRVDNADQVQTQGNQQTGGITLRRVPAQPDPASRLVVVRH